jgi:hypothetical protein
MNAIDRERVYAPNLPDDLTYRSVEHRVLRACKTLRALPDHERRFLRGPAQGSIWNQVLDEFAAYNAVEEHVKFRPKPCDVSDYLVALSWCKTLDKQEFRYIWWRSFDNVSFAVIAARIGRSDETARRRYEDVMRKVWYEAFTTYKNTLSEARGRWADNLRARSRT